MKQEHRLKAEWSCRKTEKTMMKRLGCVHWISKFLNFHAVLQHIPKHGADHLNFWEGQKQSAVEKAATTEFAKPGPK